MITRNLQWSGSLTVLTLFVPSIDYTQMRCQANTNGSQVECDLGNPMKRNTKVRKRHHELSQSSEDLQHEVMAIYPHFSPSSPFG